MLQAMQKIAVIYVGMGQLGTVTSRYLGEKDDTNQKIHQSSRVKKIAMLK
jgi:hypothetical protein